MKINLLHNNSKKSHNKYGNNRFVIFEKRLIKINRFFYFPIINYLFNPEYKLIWQI